MKKFVHQVKFWSQFHFLVKQKFTVLVSVGDSILEIWILTWNAVKTLQLHKSKISLITYIIKYFYY